MIEYIKNIIPRVKKYSQELDKIENFVEINWVFIHENGSREEYIFERDNRLIMTDSTGTKVGSWELTSTGHLLIKRSDSDYDKLENMFVEDAILILKYAVKNKPPFIAINPQIIPDLDVVKYLEKFEEEKKEKEEEKKIKYTPPSYYQILETGELSGPEFVVGIMIHTADNMILNGTYKTTHVYDDKYVVLENNFITRIFYHTYYLYKRKKLIIETYDKRKLLGNTIINASSLNLPVGKYFTIQSPDRNKLLVKINSSYKIKRAYTGGVQLIFNILYLIFIFAMFIFLFIYTNFK
jgi:hypothetical protein